MADNYYDDEIVESDSEGSEILMGDRLGDLLVNPDMIQAIDAVVIAGNLPQPNQVPVPKKESSLDPEAIFDLKVQAICFTCGICQDIMNQPTTITCQHSFCYGCLEELMKSNSRRHEKNTCPVCKEIFLLPKSNAKNHIIDDLIERMLTDEMKQLRNRETVKRTMREEIRRELRDELMPVMMRRPPIYQPDATFPPPELHGINAIFGQNGRIAPPHIVNHLNNLPNPAQPNLDYALVDRAVRIIDSRSFRWSILAIAGVMTGYTINSMYHMIKSFL